LHCYRVLILKKNIKTFFTPIYTEKRNNAKSR
jgi:hypothetical protein